MKRFHLFEFMDIKWFPGFLRDSMTEWLETYSNSFDIYHKVIPILLEGIKRSKQCVILDLCSGGGGGTIKIIEHLKKEISDIHFILTDLYPNVKSFQKVANRFHDNVDYILESVDATAIQEDLKGFRTMFWSFHHFKPETCKKILQNAVDTHSTIGIFEVFDRNVFNVLVSIFLTPLFIIFTVPLIKPRKICTWVFTYLFPLIPLFLTWDAVVTRLRTYSISELDKMTTDINVDYYHWEIGFVIDRGMKVTYLLGYPEDSKS